MSAMPVPASAAAALRKGVTIEASYDVGEYDVLILSANESNGLVEWLTDNGYRIPNGAAAVLGSYIKQNMRFFVAKVNLARMKLMGNGYLRPLQVRYETTKFMLPLRLGTVNAKGPQDLIVYVLTRSGRVEAANYRTVKLPSGMDVPLFVKAEFGKFYRAMFDRAVERENMHAVFVEYAWDMGWCDPCASEPLSNKELVELGARWIGDDGDAPFRGGGGGGGASAFVTRLHVRYDAPISPRNWRSWRRTIGKIFRGAMCCAIRGAVTRAARRPTPTGPRCRDDSGSPAGTRRKFRPVCKRRGRGRSNFLRT